MVNEEAKVHLNDGLTFGPEGEGFMRMNIATPRGVLEEGLARIVRTLRVAGRSGIPFGRGE